MLLSNNYSEHEIELYKREWGFNNLPIIPKELLRYFELAYATWLLTKIIANTIKIIHNFKEKDLQSNYRIGKFLGAYDYFMSKDFLIDCKFLGKKYDNFLGLNIEKIHQKYLLILEKNKLKEAA